MHFTIIKIINLTNTFKPRVIISVTRLTLNIHFPLTQVGGTECIYGCYVHSAILPTFHRRCYWILSQPELVLVHYLNVPFSDESKTYLPSMCFLSDKLEWTREELLDQLRPMFSCPVSIIDDSMKQVLDE